MTYIIDSHQDLAYSHLSFGRNYLTSAKEIRRTEVGTDIPERAGQTLLGWEDYQAGRIAVIFSTLFIAPKRYQSKEWEKMTFSDTAEAYRLNRSQIDLYRRWSDSYPEKFCLVKDAATLNTVIDGWENDPSSTHPVGLVMLMEGAEGIQSFAELEEWWDLGVRIIGPVWAGTRFCGGSYEKGGFTGEGLQLLEVMADLGFTLDISHMTEESALTALDRYEGKIIASHANAKALLNGPVADRHLSDLVIRRLVERGGMMGLLPYNRFLKPDWNLGDPRSEVTLSTLINHLDHVCQVTGSIDYVGIGTDFDGGFGWPAVPEEINTIADLPKMGKILEERGYNQDEIQKFMGGNWKVQLERILP